MPVPTTIKVTPIYGWGWFIAGEATQDVPAPFTIELDAAEPKRWQGLVLDEDHEFRGQRVTLSQRNVEWSGDVNVKVQPADQTCQPSTGFGMLDELPPSTLEGTG